MNIAWRCCWRSPGESYKTKGIIPNCNVNREGSFYSKDLQERKLWFPEGLYLDTEMECLNMITDFFLKGKNGRLHLYTFVLFVCLLFTFVFQSMLHENFLRVYPTLETIAVLIKVVVRSAGQRQYWLCSQADRR